MSPVPRHPSTPCPPGCPHGQRWDNLGQVTDTAAALPSSCSPGAAAADVSQMSTPVHAVSDRLVSLAEAASILGVSTKTVSRRIASGSLRATKDPSGRVLVSVPVEAMPSEERAIAAVHAQADRMSDTVDTLGSALATLRETMEARIEEASVQVQTWKRMAWTGCLLSVLLAVALVSLLVAPRHHLDSVSEEYGAKVEAMSAVSDTEGSESKEDSWPGVPFVAPEEPSR